MPKYVHDNGGQEMSICRVCGEYGDSLIKYSTRHYAHADCALNKWGADFFAKLTPFQCYSEFPLFVAKDHGVYEDLLNRANLYKP